MALGEQGPVFVKDMSYYVVPRILDDEAFSRRVTNCFLIRNPLASILSYHKLDPDLTSEEIGIEAQWHHFTGLTEMTGKAPVVLASEDVQADARTVIGKFWDEIGLAPNASAFEWQSQTPDDWEQVNAWHGDVSSSRSIRPIDDEETARKAREFETRAAQHPRLRELLKHHEPYYRKLAARALKTAD